MHSLHASYRLLFVGIFVLWPSLMQSYLLCVCVCVCVFFPTFSIMVRKSRAHKKTSTSSTPIFQSDRFLTLKNQETFEKLNVYRKVRAERTVILDEVNPKIRRSFDCRGWLPLLDVGHPSLDILIKEFYSNLSVHSTSSNI